MASKRVDRAECRPEWCAKEISIAIIGGMWKLQIVHYLLAGPRRYGELKDLISGVTDKMLAQQLRELERDGVVLRKVYPVVPSHVDYSLTEAGLALRTVLDALDSWSNVHLQTRVREAAERARTREANRLQKSR